jgi:hypothetical protein
VISAVGILAVAGAVVGITRPFGGRPANPGSSNGLDGTSLATVAERSLASQTPVNGTLGYAGSYSVVNDAQGTITALPVVGQVVNQGQALYSVDGSPVVLLDGSVPMYRDLSEGMTGADVEQLNADLVALGEATSSQLSPTSDDFSAETTAALEKLQASLGVDQTGALSPGHAVFLPTAALMTTVSATLGAPAQPGQVILQASSTTPQVSVALDAAQQTEVKAGDQVTVTLPNSDTTTGVVASVGTVASSGSSGSGAGSGSGSTPTVTVLINLTDPSAAGELDEAPVEVAITTASVSHALVVPVAALLAQSGGGYALEMVDSDGAHHLVAVTLGLFDDAAGLVQVMGSGLAAGQRVVVPAT